ncbi:hypothetical protein CAL29_01560 [Bordetella genomosp. 10]|uniref:Class II aldolase/adducin N-terminal domain-containing protein n=1 Tax=Bordetella genomosp. 10 TaxID=1416804 RepID=A0A261SIC8_9BORD|nr:class II aldolase/adducin family protein [Bordetella genomosp. 10]OZI37144.1 hypothetical protein CAL29_01560 [Bordetella genomosp. 10]
MSINPSSIPSQSASYSNEEWAARVELAAAFRLVATLGWTDLLSSHISLMVPGTTDQFLINRYGLLFDEITASNLVKVGFDGTADGQAIDAIPGQRIVGSGAWAIHSAVHISRPDLKCAIHLHTREGVAVASQKRGLLPLTQMALSILPYVRYHDFLGFSDEDERDSIASDIGDGSVLILRNHGTLTVGESVGEAFGFAWRIQRACVMQLAAQIGTVSTELNELPTEVIERASTQASRIVSKNGWARIGGNDWEALRRSLDRQTKDYQR